MPDFAPLFIPAVLAFLFILIKLAGVRELSLFGHSFSLFLEPSAESDPVSAADLLTVVGWALFIRALAYLLSAYVVPAFQIGDISSLPDRWANWDGSHYLNLARLGYSDFTEDGQHLFLVFFPLYPWLIRGLHLLIPNYQACAYLVSNLCFVGGCCYFYLLVANDFSKKTAFRSVLLLSLFPFAFFFGAVRTESLFFLTSAASLYYIRKHRFFPASVWGALAALSRMQGLLLAVAAAAEIISAYHPFAMLKEKRFHDFWTLCWQKVIFLPLTAVGTLIYLLLNYHVSGNPFQFLIYQKEHWFQGSTLFTNTLQIIWNQITSADPDKILILWFPQFVLFFFGLVVLLIGIRRIPATYSVYFFIYFFMNFSITWPLSCGRYMTCALPMFVVLAESSRRHPHLHRGLLTASAMLFAVYIPLFLMNLHLY